VRALKGHSGRVFGVAFSADGRFALSVTVHGGHSTRIDFCPYYGHFKGGGQGRSDAPGGSTTGDQANLIGGQAEARPSLFFQQLGRGSSRAKGAKGGASARGGGMLVAASMPIFLKISNNRQTQTQLHTRVSGIFNNRPSQDSIPVPMFPRENIK